MNKMKLNISYFGSRNYIDVSTLTSALYEALPNITNNNLITEIKGRLLKKISSECSLIFHENTSEEKLDKDNASKLVAVFEWLFNEVKHTAYFIETDTIITSRRTEELEKELEYYMTFNKGEVTINEAINDDCIYNLMKMGRLIITKNYSLAPRVVRFYFDRLYNQSEMKGIVMKSIDLGKNDFYRLETFKDNKKFGEIIIKALQNDS